MRVGNCGIDSLGRSSCWHEQVCIVSTMERRRYVTKPDQEPALVYLDFLFVGGESADELLHPDRKARKEEQKKERKK